MHPGLCRVAGMSAEEALTVFAGEISLAPRAVTPFEWEGVFQRLASQGERDQHTKTVRALRLNGEGNENDFGGLSGGPLTALVQAFGRLTHLTSLSISDVKLHGSAAQQLLLALGSVPAFAMAHSEVWPSLEVAAEPPQGARLCIARAGLSDADLFWEDKRLRSLRMGGVTELVLTGNLGFGDVGFDWLYDLVPAVRQLHLGGTGVTGAAAHGGGGGGGGRSVFARLCRGWNQVGDARKQRQWPLLEALCLRGTPLSDIGFRELQLSLCERHAHSKAADDDGTCSGRGLVHLDLRRVTLTAPELRALSEKYTDFNANLPKPPLPWVSRQAFGGGRLSALEKPGVVLRHDYESRCTVRFKLELSEGEGGSEVAHACSPVLVSVEELEQQKALSSLLFTLKASANPRGKKEASRDTKDKQAADALAVSDALRRAQFPFAVINAGASARDDNSEWVCASCDWRGHDGVSRDYSDEARRLSIMLGNLMSDHRDPAGRKLDAQLGAPRSRSEAKRIVELSLGLRLTPRGRCTVALSVELRGGGVGGADAPPVKLLLEDVEQSASVGALLERLSLAANPRGRPGKSGGFVLMTEREEEAERAAAPADETGGDGAGGGGDGGDGDGGAESKARVRRAGAGGGLRGFLPEVREAEKRREASEKAARELKTKLRNLGFPFAFSNAEQPNEWVRVRARWHSRNGSPREAAGTAAVPAMLADLEVLDEDENTREGIEAHRRLVRLGVELRLEPRARGASAVSPLKTEAPVKTEAGGQRASSPAADLGSAAARKRPRVS